jgi:hypothetical protein
MSDDHRCPRCTGWIPNAQTPGAYPGALSRVAPVYVCSDCGLDEAMRDLAGRPPVGPPDWPVGPFD